MGDSLFPGTQRGVPLICELKVCACPPACWPTMKSSLDSVTLVSLTFTHLRGLVRAAKLSLEGSSFPQNPEYIIVCVILMTHSAHQTVQRNDRSQHIKEDHLLEEPSSTHLQFQSCRLELGKPRALFRHRSLKEKPAKCGKWVLPEAFPG